MDVSKTFAKALAFNCACSSITGPADSLDLGYHWLVNWGLCSMKVLLTNPSVNRGWLYSPRLQALGVYAG